MTSNLELFPQHTKTAQLRAIHSDGSSEWYSDPDHVGLARQALGDFDYDPASNPEANTIIRAARHGGRQADGAFVDGLAVDAWRGCVWLNAPGPEYETESDGTRGKRIPGTGPKPFWQRLVYDVTAGYTTRAHYVAYSLEQIAQSQRWAGAGILAFADAVCFPASRVRYWRKGESGELEKGDAPAHASAYACIVRPTSRSPRADFDAVEQWCDLFASLGSIVVVRP